MGQCNKFFRLLPGFMQRFEKIHVWLEAKKDFRMQASGSPGGGWWIRTTEGVASRFTVCPLWPLGKSPIYEVWSWWTDSNPRPADYKSAALPAELHQRLTSEDYITRLHPVCQQKFSPPAGIVGCNIKCERTSPLFSGSFEPSAFIFLYHKPR